MNADPIVMEYFPSALSRAESDAMIDGMQEGLEERGWGLWCLEIDGTCAGFVGLSVPTFDAHFTPCIEIGWRMATKLLGARLRTGGCAACRLTSAFGSSG